MFGIGLGSLVTGQLVTRTGRTAVFPSYGYVAATAGLSFIAFWVPHLSLSALPWVFGATACFMGAVMGVVQVNVQAVAGQRMLGTRRWCSSPAPSALPSAPPPSPRYYFRCSRQATAKRQVCSEP